jgi:histidine ammonia-lyase
MAHNTAVIIGIETLAAAQGIDFHAPLTTAPKLADVHQRLRQRVTFYAADRLFAPDIEAAKSMVMKGELSVTCRDMFNGWYLP